MPSAASIILINNIKCFFEGEKFGLQIKGRVTYNNSFVQEKQEFIHALLMYITELIHICTDSFSEKNPNQQMLKTAKVTRLVIWDIF